MKKNLSLLKNNDLICGVYVFAAVFLRYVMWGFTYFYQLDDYIQYYAYPMRPNPWEVVAEQGLLSSRPLAGLSDIFLWGRLFNCMILAVLVISIMYAASAVLFSKVFKKHFKTGFMFTLIYGTAPFFIEAVYWVSASTRLVAGLFFTSLALYLLHLYLENGKKPYIPLFRITQLLSLCFYEQVFILSCALCFFIVLLKGEKRHFRLIGVILFNAVLYFAFTAIFKNTSSALGNRLSIVIPSLSPWYMSVLTDLLSQIKTAFLSAPVKITFGGFARGIKLIIENGHLVALIISALSGAGAFFLCGKSKRSKPGLSSLIIAVILAVAPVALFFVISNPYVSLRNIMPSFVGIAIICDMAFGLITEKSRFFGQLCAGVLAFIFFISGVSELYDYKTIYEFDNEVGRSIEAVMKENNYEHKTAFIIDRKDIGDLHLRFHERGSGVTSSGWALQGILNYYDLSNKENNKKAVPIETENGIYSYAWEKGEKNLASFDKLYYWDDGGLVEVFYAPTGEFTADLVGSDGSPIATAEDRDGIGYISYRE